MTFAVRPDIEMAVDHNRYPLAKAQRLGQSPLNGGHNLRDTSGHGANSGMGLDRTKDEIVNLLKFNNLPGPQCPICNVLEIGHNKRFGPAKRHFH